MITVPVFEELYRRFGIEKSSLALQVNRGNYQMYSTTSGKPYMIRVYQQPNSSQIRQKFRNEAYVMTKMYQHKEIPSPDLIATFFGDDNSYAALVMEKIEGIPLHEAWSFISDEQRILLAKELASILSNMHKLKVDGYGSPDVSYDQWSIFLRDRIESGLDVLSSVGLSINIVNKIHSRLEIWLPGIEDPPSTVVHGDLNPHNILITSVQSTPTISGIIDWEWALLGDPHYDLVAIESLFYNSIDILSAFEDTYGDKFSTGHWKVKQKLYLVDKFIQNAWYHVTTNRYTTQRKHLTEFMLSTVLK